MDQAALRRTFEETGFVRLDRAFAGDLAAALCERLRLDAGEAQKEKKLGDYRAAPFRAVFESDAFSAALDAILGEGRWLRPDALQDVRLKPPGPERPRWWHIDVFERGAETTDEDVLSWRASLEADRVGVLATLLLSDVEDQAAPTEVRAGTHRLVSARLAQAGKAGISLGDLLQEGLAEKTKAAEAIRMTGAAGTAFLCHPLLVHTPLANRGSGPIVTALQPIRLKA